MIWVKAWENTTEVMLYPTPRKYVEDLMLYPTPQKFICCIPLLANSYVEAQMEGEHLEDNEAMSVELSWIGLVSSYEETGDTKDIQGNATILCDTTLVDTRHYTFDHTLKMHNTKSES